MLRKWFPELLITAGLLVLPLLLFFPVTLGGKTQIPADNLYEYEPWLSAREPLGVPEVPHNALISDLILENYQWKSFLRQSIRDGVIPLWQTEQFAGTPFLAAGQHSALYPFSVLYYVLPLWLAYGWFTVSQLWLAGVLMMLFARGLGVGRLGAAVAGVAYQLSAFFVISAVFPMMIAGAAWLPLLLLMIEFIVRRRPLRGERPAVIPWIAVGAVALMMNVFAGHVEITYYTLIVMAYYAAARLLWEWWRARRAWKRLTSTAASLLAMVALGMGLGAAQFVPLYELGTHSFRESAASFDDVRSWGLPVRHAAAFFVPDVFGNPADHSYIDVFDWERVSVQWMRGAETTSNTHFGIKNYVEGAVYMGILVMALAAIGLIAPRRKQPPVSSVGAVHELPLPGDSDGAPPIRAILAILGGVSLTFAFGLPTYAVLYYLFPSANQLHTPFRWVWPLTFVVAALAGYGADALTCARRDHRVWRVATWAGGGLLAAGVLILLALAASRIAFGTIEPQVADLYLKLAPDASASDARGFYSYEFWNVLYFGLATLAAGIVILLSRARWALPGRLRTVPLWQPLAVAVIAVDLLAAGWNFNTAADPGWLDYTPPSVAWLQDKMAAEGPFRYTTLDQGEHPLHANSTWQYDLQDARGYDSLIPKQYADYMRLIAPQGGLDYNRIDPIQWDDKDALASPLLDLLDVRYVVSDWYLDPDGNAGADASRADELGYTLVYDDGAVRIYENLDALPRAYTLPYYDLTEELCGSAPDDFGTIVQSPDFTADPRRVVIEGFPGGSGCDVVYDWPTAEQEADPVPATITAYGSIEVTVDASVDQASWLVLADSYYPGWKAFVRPQGAAEDQEDEVEIRLVDGNFRGVRLDPGAWTVRFRFSPPTFQIGAFGSFISGMLIVFMLILWIWRRIYREDGETDSAKRIAKNSLAPIVLNLFNRVIDFAFAFIMLRILGPANAGVYYYAIVIFGWFDILTNFGLNTFLTREVARDRDRAGRYLLNTTALRLALVVIGIPLLVLFFVVRDRTVAEPLETQAVVAIILLYVALLPGSISTGLTALFYAFEKAEFPAAITTVSTIAKVTIGLATLLLGWGVEGLAGGAVATNLITFAVLAWLARPLIRGQFWGRPDRALMRHMMGESWPLMINHLLATVFFKIDVVLMEAINGNTVVGQYSTAYKWLDALNIIPAFLTMALLPVMARQAHEDRAALKRNYTLAVKLLLMVALPVAVITTFIAEPLVHFLGGAEYLPAGAIALQLMIWSILIGWMNSVTNYVIVALDRQRTLTFAFVAGVVFNLTANILLLPAYSYRAAAIVTIFSEGVLFVGFYWIIRQELGSLGWGHMLGRLAVAGIVLAAITWGLWSLAPLLALAAAPVVYVGTLLALRPFLPEELARIAPLLPGPLRRRIAVGG